MYKITRLPFDYLQIKPSVAELGVLRGESALEMFTAFKPRSRYLIASWSAQLHDEYEASSRTRPWMTSVNPFAEYYGGPLNDQAIFDRLPENTVSKFAKCPEVAIIRASTIAARDVLLQKLGAGYGLDYLYVDASHQYEGVHEDLMLYAGLVVPDGIIQLNDCCHSSEGVRQNLGVLEAVTKFWKMTEYIPLLISNTEASVCTLQRIHPC